MIIKYLLRYSQTFLSKQQQLASKDKKTALKIVKTLELLSINPLAHSLHSHKVNAVGFGESYSSSVTGDIRIIWNYDKDERLIILVLNLGSHSGKAKVYK